MCFSYAILDGDGTILTKSSQGFFSRAQALEAGVAAAHPGMSVVVVRL